ncbi:AI-2E family transporter [Candidatus Microgenomates bacterium]|nr:AI-2E family transporter [Candidatus Microgenomates bacterium]
MLYISRGIITPFFLAAITAYILNPAINILSRKLRIPRILSIVFVYIFIIGLLSLIVINIGFQFGEESREFTREANTLFKQTNTQLNSLPEWLQPLATDTFESVRGTIISPNKKLVEYLPTALNGRSHNCCLY